MNYIKLVGAMIIVCSTAWVGINASGDLHRTMAQMQSLLSALNRMDCEIRYARTPFPKLCRVLGEEKSEVGRFFRILSCSDMTQKRADGWTRTAVKNAGLALPSGAQLALEEFIDSFGKYDADGQAKLLHLAQSRISLESAQLEQDFRARARMYRLLGACAGIALIILVI